MESASRLRMPNWISFLARPWTSSRYWFTAPTIAASRAFSALYSLSMLWTSRVTSSRIFWLISSICDWILSTSGCLSRYVFSSFERWTSSSTSCPFSLWMSGLLMTRGDDSSASWLWAPFRISLSRVSSSRRLALASM